MLPKIEYTPSPTGWLFHQSDVFMRGLMGPVGSGKSVTCSHEIFKRANEADHSSKWAIVRNSYRELEDTTLSTWMDWFRPYGEFTHRNMTHRIPLQHDRELTVIFRALDKPQDIGKLLSLELTGAWFNEAREIPYTIVKNMRPRVLRYPPAKTAPAAWHGIILDTNPPDDMHWWFNKFEDQRPEGWQLFRQPSGMSEGAENIANLVPGYYETIAAGEDQAWIDVYVHGQYGFVMDGKPVWPQFNDAKHVAPDVLEPAEGQKLIVGIDFGLTPAAVVMQQDVDGQWRVLDEIVTQDMSADEFATHALGPLMRGKYRDHEAEYWGDPAGVGRAQSDKSTPFQMLAAAGIKAHPAKVSASNPNDFTLRVEVVAKKLRSLAMSSEPALIISPVCRYLRRGLAGGYKYRQLQVGGETAKYNPEPEKNIYSHVSEALQYALIGAGEHQALIGGQEWPDIDYSTLDRAAI